MKVTQSKADEILTQDLDQWESYVNEALTVEPNQNEFDAMVSLCHNIGPRGFQGSTVVHMFNSGKLLEAAKAFLMWEHPPSLKLRRQSEMNQFLRSDT